MGKDIRVGLILKPERYILDGFVCASTPHIVRGVVQRFSCELIANQEQYDRLYDKVDVFFSFEPNFAAPVLKWKPRNRLGFRSGKPKLSYVLCSDPHIVQWREKYFLDNDISFMLTFYHDPFRRHFKDIPEERFVDFPWTVPDSWFSDEPVRYHGQESICCFGGSKSPAYTVRNWCREFDFVEDHRFSGVENKVMEDVEYFRWLEGFDAAIAAGSDDPKYDLTTPKYFEIAAAGCLLLGQRTSDVERLGFRDMENCVLFDRSDFEEKARACLADPESYLKIRSAGKEMVRQRHALSVRLDFLESHIRRYL